MRHDFDFLNFVGCTETIKEMKHWQAGFNGRQMSYAGQIHDFLHTAAAEHAPTGITTAHDVRMVTKNGKGVRAYRTGSYVKDSRFARSSNTVHNRDHQHEALGSRIGRAQRTGFDNAVQRADSACFSLHFHDPDRLAKEVFHTVRSPNINVFRHRRRRGNWENCCNFCKRIRYVCSCFVAIHSFHQFFAHF